MKFKSLATGFLATAAIFASAPVANAEYFVPPGNSAANQYTQTLPSAGGGDSTNGGAGQSTRKPSKALGHEKAAQLEEQGQAGRELAEVVAATAPPSAATDESSGSGSKHQAGDGGKKKSGHKKKQQGKGDKPAKSKSGEKGTGAGAGATTPPAAGGGQPAGESALGQLTGKVTGVSTDGSSILLPLVILASIAWAIGFAVMRRRRPVS